MALPPIVPDHERIIADLTTMTFNAEDDFKIIQQELREVLGRYEQLELYDILVERVNARTSQPRLKARTKSFSVSLVLVDCPHESFEDVVENFIVEKLANTCGTVRIASIEETTP